MVGERALSTGQTAKRLEISVRTVYRWEAVRRLGPISRLPSGQRRFSSRDVDALLRSRTAGAERCAVYARVSSEKQAETGNLARQRERLVSAAMDIGIWGRGRGGGTGCRCPPTDRVKGQSLPSLSHRLNVPTWTLSTRATSAGRRTSGSPSCLLIPILSARFVHCLG